MPTTKRTAAPKDKLKIRRLPQVGEEIWIRARVTRTGRNSYGTGDTVTLRIGDHPAPVTTSARFLETRDED